MSNPDISTPHTSSISPFVMMGAMGPLWAYYGAVAMGGVAYWYATRWSRTVNLEAAFAVAIPEAPADLPAPMEVVAAASEIVADLPDVARLPEPELPPVAVPPVVEMLPEPTSARVLEVAPEPVAETVAELPVALEVVPALKLRPRKAAAGTPDVEA